MSPQNQSVPLAESQHHVIDPTNPGGALDDGVEDRLHVRRRAADDAEHLGRCRLMLQRLAQFRVAFLQFFEQPDVLDGDHRLIGEGFYQLNLPLRKRLYKIAPDCNRSDWGSLSQQRHIQQRSRSMLPSRKVVARLCFDIKDMDSSLSRNARPEKLSGIGR